jgi:hypothetical protein
MSFYFENWWKRSFFTAFKLKLIKINLQWMKWTDNRILLSIDLELLNFCLGWHGFIRLPKKKIKIKQCKCSLWFALVSKADRSTKCPTCRDNINDCQ